MTPLSTLVTYTLLTEAARRYPNPTVPDCLAFGEELDALQLSPAIRGAVLGALADAVREGGPCAPTRPADPAEAAARAAGSD